MPRTPHQPAELGDTAGPMPAGHAITVAGEQETADIEREAAFVAAKIVGRIESALFSETVSQKVIVESFLELKKSKAYRAVEYRDADGNLKRVSDLEEFCERYLKRSYRRVKQMSDNYHLIGADLYESAEQIGFRQKDYTALKGLPADDQEVIKQAMSAETDRDQVIDLLQEMAARHASEKAALTAQAKEATETAEARSDVIAKKESMINALQESNSKLKRRQATLTDEEKRDYECAPLHDAINESMVALLKMATEVKRLVEEVGGELVTEECFHAVLLPIKRALEIAAHNGLHIDLATLFDEQIDASVEALQARAAGLTGALQ